MADISDVGDALVSMIEGRLYPNGPGNAGGYVPPVSIYRGWPDPGQLDVDLKETSPGTPKRLHVSVFPLPAERDASRYDDQWEELARPAATYAAAVLGQAITITGAAVADYSPQNIAAGIHGQPRAYVYTAQAGDTPAQIAAALGALILADVAGVTVVGATINIPQPRRITFARVGVVADIIREVARADKSFQITIWANNDAQRAALAKRLDPLLASAVRFDLADGSQAYMTRRASNDIDAPSREGAYRRDLVYSVEYAITEADKAAEIVAFETTLKDPDGVTVAEQVE